MFGNYCFHEVLRNASSYTDNCSCVSSCEDLTFKVIEIAEKLDDDRIDDLCQIESFKQKFENDDLLNHRCYNVFGRY